MAEGFFRKDSAKESFSAASAGIMSSGGQPPSENSVKAMAEEDIDISSYRSSFFNEKLANESDVILTMEEGHKEFILSNFPFTRGKVSTLAEFAEESGDVPDPVGMAYDTYKRTADHIKRLVEKSLKKLREK